MAKYQWRLGGPPKKVSADVFGKVVERIEAEKGGQVKPQDIVSEAQKRGSPIHKICNWNKDKAANLHWLAIARHYLHSLQIVRVDVTHGRKETVRAFHSLHVANGKRAYISDDRVRSNESFRNQAIDNARRELQIYIMKFEGILELGQFIDRLKAVLDDMTAEADSLSHEAKAPNRNANGGTSASAPPPV